MSAELAQNMPGACPIILVVGLSPTFLTKLTLRLMDNMLSEEDDLRVKL